MSDFTRPKDGFPYELAGLKINAQANNIPPNKFPYISNLRSLGGGSLRVRPGTSQRFTTEASPITDIRAYTSLKTDDKPRLLARNSLDHIWLDNSLQVGSLSPGGSGAILIPFRPNQSPTPWMYIANSADYQKFSAPDATNSVTQRKVGIAEPQSSPDACADTRNVFKLVNSDNAGSWVNTGQAGAPGGISRGSPDTAVAFFLDPAAVAPIISPRYSMQVGSNQYQVGEFINVAINGGGTTPMTVDDVFPAINPQSNVTILSITYYSGVTGRCVIVPSQMPISGLVQGSAGNPTAVPTNSPDLISSLRRGSLITLNNGGGNAETVFVLSVTEGPQGIIAIETSTANTHATTEPIIGQSALSVTFTTVPATMIGQAITSLGIQSAITGAGSGTLALAITGANNPFTHQGIPSFAFLPTPQQEDYVHISLNISDLTKVTDIQIQFDVGDGSFTQNFYYYDIQPSALTSAVAGTTTQLGASQIAAQQAAIRASLSSVDLAPIRQIGALDFNRPDQAPLPSDLADLSNVNPSAIAGLGASQWSEILFSIASLTRVGTDATKTLANCNGCRILINATAAFTFQFGSIWVGAGSQPDVGDAGALYQYRVAPRDSRTGVKGNPSPATRYGISPRRQQVILSLPSAAYDSQIDTWDIFRFGGSVTSWRYIGSAPSSAATFTDQVFDDAAQAGDALDFDDFEPWPSVDLQYNGTASTVSGTVAIVTIAGSLGLQPLNWLPGTLVQLAGGLVYTLRLRPVMTSGTIYRLEFIECAFPGTNISVSIPEPLVANQHLPYIFGPDSEGRILACGDPLRPGTLYYSKPNNPDSCPDTYNREITPPSEPLLGGEIIDGRGWLASTERWWELLPQQTSDPTQFYNPVQSPIPRGLAAPYAHCNDGANLYWMAKDGILSSRSSLTDADLYNIFPHEGRAGESYSYSGNTLLPPDVAGAAATFRLVHSNGYLYYIYKDTGGTFRMLTCDLKRGGAWVVDSYPTQITAAYHIEQQPGAFLSSSAYDETIFGNASGVVMAQQKDTNDLSTPISCSVFSFEWDGGDARAPKQWGDFFVDLTPNANLGVVASSISQGAILAGTTQTIAKSSVRQRVPLSVGGIVVSDFMGLELSWSDDFLNQSSATILNLWQPSYDIQPARQIAWQTFGSSYGISGFGHIPWLEIAYLSTQPITLTISVVDGTSPSPITLPSTGGVYTKALFRPTFNKGRLYNFSASSAATFQIFEDDCVIMWAPWGRTGPIEMKRNLGVPNVAESVV